LLDLIFKEGYRMMLKELLEKYPEAKKEYED